MNLFWEILKHISFPVVFGWIPWTGVSLVIARTTRYDFNTAYLYVGLAFIVLLALLLLSLTKRVG